MTDIEHILSLLGVRAPTPEELSLICDLEDRFLKCHHSLGRLVEHKRAQQDTEIIYFSSEIDKAYEHLYEMKRAAIFGLLGK